MNAHHDVLETRPPEIREADLFARLPAVLAAALKAPAYAERLASIDPATITDRKALAGLPILRKADLPALQRTALPFGGFVADAPGSFGRLFTSPGPIFEPEGTAIDAWGAARGLYAAGFRPGDIVLMHTWPDKTVEAMPEIIARLRAKGLRFVTVSELLALTPR